MTEANDPIDGEELPPALTPTDEAMLTRTQTLREIADAVLRDIAQPHPADEHGALLRHALLIQGLTGHLVDQAAVAERERGASWTAIGEAAGTSRQSAHERWNRMVGEWVRRQRRRTGTDSVPADPAVHARELDDWFAALTGDQQAVSALLPSLHDEDARTEANTHRAEVKQLNQRIKESYEGSSAAYEAVEEARGTDQAESTRAVWAAGAFARADAFERLAVVEKPRATEHRRDAALQRTKGQDILRGLYEPGSRRDPEVEDRIRVSQAYGDLTREERGGSESAVTALLAERLDGIPADTLREYLGPVIEAHREKRRRSYNLNIAACSAPDRAQYAADTALSSARLSVGEFFRSQARTLLIGYLTAAALDGAGLDTLRTWTRNPDDSRPLELLRSGAEPQLAAACEQILSSHKKTLANVLIIVQAALQGARPDPGGTP
ncbi:hypothetical protein ACIBEA_40455 [Streptomyces sp. NPDC051555]|uniref:hypothetical protein n=1 Tax=Streptomyces sp. NPDC051555 TaxID=3365657 RepID=UPI00379FDC5D